MSEPLNEKRIEELYWEFDFIRSAGNISERDCFKKIMRKFAHEELVRYLSVDKNEEAWVD